MRARRKSRGEKSGVGGRDPRRGASLVEVTISLVILVVAIFGLGSTAARLTRVTFEAEARSLALQAVEDRLSLIRMHPVYLQLDSVFSEEGTEVPGLPGYTRSTVLHRVREPGSRPGKCLDYTRITVTVDGPGLSEPMARTIAVGGA